MTKAIVTGHGGYATAMQRSLGMLVGELEGFTFVDFNEEDSIDILQGRLDEVLSRLEEGDQVLFICDLSGGTPFRVAATICAGHPGWATVAGINTSAYSELSFNMELSAVELAELAADVTRESILVFPPRE